MQIKPKATLTKKRLMDSEKEKRYRLNCKLIKVMNEKRRNQPTPSDPLTFTIREHIDVAFKEDGEIGKFDLRGVLSLRLLDRKDGFIRVQIETGDNPGIVFKPHPSIDNELFGAENILAFKDPKKPFPPCSVNPGITLLTWERQFANESLLPLSIKCLHSVSGNETRVSLRYDGPWMFELQNVMIYIPIPELTTVPRVLQIDGEWSYDSVKSIFEWSIARIDKSNCSGSLEFVVPTLELLPVSLRLTTTNTFVDLKVINVLPLGVDNPPKFSQKNQPSTDNFDFIR